MRKIFFRADGNKTIGWGHVYRLLALAEMLRADFECVFVIDQPDPFLLAQIERSCASYIDLKKSLRYQTPDAMHVGEEMDFDMEGILTGNEIVVTDGYLFGQEYQSKIKNSGAKLVCIDDLATTFFIADIVINHAPGIPEGLYKKAPHTILLSGLDYAILRQSFFKVFNAKSDRQKKAFISLGGSDAQQYTLRIAESLSKSGVFAGIDILASSSFGEQWLNTIKSHLPFLPGAKLHIDLSGDELVSILDGCTHAFVAASTVLIESYARGLECFAGYYANNQLFIYNGFVNEKLAIGFDHFDTWDIESVHRLLNESSKLKKLATPLCSTVNVKNIFTSLYADTSIV